MRIGFLGTFTEVDGQAIYLEHEIKAWRQVFPDDVIFVASEAGIAPKREIWPPLIEQSFPPSGRFHLVECWNRHDLKDGDFGSAKHILTANHLDIVNVMHEWGLFGFPDGQGGMYRHTQDSDKRFINFTHNLQASGIPVVITLFTPSLFGDISKYFAELSAAHYIVQGGRSDLDIMIGENKVPPEKVSFVQEPLAPYDETRETILSVRDRLGLPSGCIFLVTGFWRLENRIGKIIEAFKIAYDYAERNKLQIPTLVFAGTVHPNDKGPVKEYLRQCMMWAYRKGLAKNVIFTNKFHTEKEVDDYLYACDVALSYRETNTHAISTSGAAFRAMAAKRPLIAFDSSGVSQLPSNTCIKVRSAEEMGERMIDLMTHSSKTDLLLIKLLQAQNLFYQTYSCYSAVQRYREIFQRVIDTWHPAGS